MPVRMLEELLVSLGFPAYRGRQVFSWLHGKLAVSFDAMTDLPLQLRQDLSRISSITVPQVLEESPSGDGATKFLLGLADGLAIETVLIPGEDRVTACLSTQVGCPLGCLFCMTGRAGFRRNLAPDEIVAQFQCLQRKAPDRIGNVVFMGMGEPLLNFAAVEAAIGVFTSRGGAGIGTRHITISTVGIPQGIRRLEALPGQIGLAVSLHSAIQETRARIVPAAAKWRLPELREALEHYSKAVNRSVTLEFCLLAGVNDSPREADALRSFTRGLECKINLMSWNEIPGMPWKRPTEESLLAFGRRISHNGPAVTIRRSRGSDVCGACGQLGASLLATDRGRASGDEGQHRADGHP
jgi:23S rRNA (adenine2503-C2)-methyltransferase